MVEYKSLLRDWGIAVAIVIFALLLMLALDPWLAMTQTPFLLFFGAVPLAAWSTGRYCGILTTILSGLAANYFFIPPTFALSFDAMPGGRTAIFLVEGILISLLVGSLRESQWQTKESLRQLRVSEAKFRRLADSNVIGVVFASLNGAITEANDAFLHSLGYTRTDLITGKIRWDAMTPAEFHALDAVACEELITQGKCTPFEKVYVGKQGNRVPVLVGAALLEDNDDRVISFILDLTELKQAEQEREQLLLRERTARTKAEALEQQSRFLAEATTVLASSLNYEHTLKSVAQLAVPTLADWCVVDVLTGDQTLARLATAHVDPAKIEWAAELYRRYPPDLNAPQGLAQVLRTGKSEYYPDITDEQLQQGAQDAEHLKILRQVGLKSVMIVPLMAREKILGTMSFIAAESGHTYTPADLAFAEELARRAAIALDNARLYQDAQQAQQIAEQAADRTTRLQTVTAALAESLTPAQVANVMVEQSMAALAADSVIVALLTSDRTELEVVQAVGYEPDLVETWQRFSLHTSVPLAETVRSGQPMWSEHLADRIARYPHLASVYRRLNHQTWMSLPLIVQGQVIGGIAWSFKQAKTFSQESRNFILALTQQCAQAIARAQLYEAERQARAEAEQANRVKDEFLAVLSHELRTPLNPIVGWAKLLRTGKLDKDRTAVAIETIERNAKLQTQLIEDLLDISRILQGKLTLNVVWVDLREITEAAIETMHLAAEAKSIQIQTHLEPAAISILGDPNRLQQVIWNLLSNAVKFTSNGGQVWVELKYSDSYAYITVQDTGKGIHSDFLPYVFEYFRQADSSTTRRFGGLGLGLAIARQIVELHGGTIEAESQGEGSGATFRVTLPLMQNKRKEPPPTVNSFSLSASAPLQGTSILVVDDDADARDLVEFVLEQAGAEVTVADSAEKALQNFNKFL
ncbi:MAG TPA: ATP-binding protein, partial [Allocoleopsis sp.]